MSRQTIDILFEDERILLINKPTGISVTPDRTGAPDIQQLLASQHSLSEPLRLVHRLDKDTSGVMIIAKNKVAQSRYSRLFAKRQARKLYLAVVRGPLGRAAGSIKDPIARSKRNPQAMHVHPRLGKPAHTVWRQLADYGLLALVAVQPVTGRTHQIRIHFAHRGMPLAIDPVYGASEPLMLSSFKMKYRSKRDKEESPLISRLTLHAYQLTVPVGPADDPQVRTFVAPLDKKFAAAVKMLTKHTQNDAPGFADPADCTAILAAQPLAYPLPDETNERILNDE